MIVFAVVVFRTDTTKEGEQVLELFMDRKDAQDEVDKRNTNEFLKNADSVYRCAVREKEVK
jgi:hypothetical protein